VFIAEIPHISLAREIDSSRGTIQAKGALAPNYEDSVSICEEGRAVSKLLVEMNKLQKKENPSIEELKQKVHDGTYDVSSEEIAKAILYGPPKKS
jgi:anti-sigma28 factor (negative regulator of flagellin synthesis)